MKIFAHLGQKEDAAGEEIQEPINDLQRSDNISIETKAPKNARVCVRMLLHARTCVP